MTQNLNRNPVGMIGHISHKSAMETFLITGLVEAMKDDRGPVILGVDPGRPDTEETVAAAISGHLENLEIPFYLHDVQRCPGRRRRVVDESAPWPPKPVDKIVAKRIARAEEKRARKKAKRAALKAAGKIQNKGEI